MSKRMLVWMGVLAVVAGLAAAVRSPAQQNVETIMRMKLQHTQAILEGIATEDFDKIAKDASAVALLSQAAAWQVLQTPEYQQHSSDFRRAADDLARSAREKNLDAAALAYVRLTMGCVNCHKYMRGVRVAGIEAFDLGPLAGE
jgi:type II secretory pathway component PulM